MANTSTPGGSARTADRRAGRPGDGLIRGGAVVFAVGVLAILLVVIPFLFGASDLPLALNVAAGVLPPLGLGLALAGLVRAGRAAGRERRRAAAEPAPAVPSRPATQR